MPDIPELRPYRKLAITAIREEAPGVKTFFLATADGEAMPYAAGQFLTFIFNGAGGEERRSYSLSSAPSASEPLAITVKRVENGAHSRWLIDRAAAGDTLLCTGSAGLFTLPERPGDYPQLLFFAAGIGITPVYALIKELLSSGARNRLTLFYSSRSLEETVFYKELRELEAQHQERFQIEWRFSNARNLLKARISKPVFPALLKQYLAVPPDKALCYICGPEDYRWMVQLLLEEAGIRNIRKEIFLPGRLPLPSLPPDTDAHKVVIRIGGTEYRMVVQYPDTILSAAKKQGISLPYSCAAGRCASCICRAEAGTVWMAYNEVLTEQDRKNGLVLTCTGYPVHGDVVLNFP